MIFINEYVNINHDINDTNNLVMLQYTIEVFTDYEPTSLEMDAFKEHIHENEDSYLIYKYSLNYAPSWLRFWSSDAKHWDMYYGHTKFTLDDFPIGYNGKRDWQEVKVDKEERENTFKYRVKINNNLPVDPKGITK